MAAMVALQSVGTESPEAEAVGLREPRKVRKATVPGASAAASLTICWSWSASEPVRLYLLQPALSLCELNVAEQATENGGDRTCFG